MQQLDSGILTDNEGFLLIFWRFGDGIVITLTISEGSLVEVHSEVFVEGRGGRLDLHDNPGW